MQLLFKSSKIVIDMDYMYAYLSVKPSMIMIPNKQTEPRSITKSSDPVKPIITSLNSWYAIWWFLSSHEVITSSRHLLSSFHFYYSSHILEVIFHCSRSSDLSCTRNNSIYIFHSKSWLFLYFFFCSMDNPYSSSASPQYI